MLHYHENQTLTTVKMNVVCDLSCSNVNLHCIVDFDDWIWVPDGAGIEGAQVRNSFLTRPYFANLAQLVLWRKKIKIFINYKQLQVPAA